MMPMAINLHVTVIADLARTTKLLLVPGLMISMMRASISLQMLLDLSGPRDIIKSYTTRVHTTAVNNVVMIPTHSVIANPLIGPEPNWNKMMPERNVVTWVSRMAGRARS